MSIMIDTSKISDESLIQHMKTIFKNANDGRFEYENSMALYEAVKDSDDPDLIEAVIKSSAYLNKDEAHDLASRLCELQGTKSNVYLKVADETPSREIYEQSEDVYHRGHYRPSFHLRLLIKLRYDKENIDVDKFLDISCLSDEEVIKKIDDYLFNQAEIDREEIKRKLTDVESELKHNERCRLNIEERAKALTKQLEGK